ncbi:MAG: ROK family transcriptional regulator [Stappiaceae bacterium]
MRDEKGRVATENERTILDIIHRNPGISRSSLTNHTDWKQQSVNRLVHSLISRELVQVGEASITGPGQPSPKLTVNHEAGYAFGISLNTDAIRLSLVNLGCEELECVFVETDPSDRGKALKAIRRAADDLSIKYRIGRDNVLGFGFAITGFRLSAPDMFSTPPPLREWSEMPLLQPLMESLGFPVWIENNATAGAIAESLVGAGRNHSSFSYLSFNFGFGSGIIIDGKPLTGTHNNAGEIGFLFKTNEKTSRPALGELLKRLNARGNNVSSIRELNQRFDPDWPGVREWVEEVTPSLNLAIRALSATTDPSAIVFGGEAPVALQDILIAAADPFPAVEPSVSEPVRPVLLNSSIEGDAATFGAALLPIKQSVLL